MNGEPVREGVELGKGEVMGTAFTGPGGALAGVRDGVIMGASFHPPLSCRFGGGGGATAPLVREGGGAGTA